MFDRENLTPAMFEELQIIAMDAWNENRIDFAEYEQILESIGRLEELL